MSSGSCTQPTKTCPAWLISGCIPTSLFDTELAGRLAGFPRVGLATMVENLLGWRMEKDHSAADWSSRPLPQPWLRYAALDVELLIELRDALEAELDKQGKLGWAHEEFEHVRTAPTAAVSVERWRRVSGIHKIRQRRQLAIVRSMWDARDQIARDTDISPSRLLPDTSIVEVATTTPVERARPRELARLPRSGQSQVPRAVVGGDRPCPAAAR